MRGLNPEISLRFPSAEQLYPELYGETLARENMSQYSASTAVRRRSVCERLREFEEAVRTVYASTMSSSALDYRLRRGLAGWDEQMALLVQRVSGSRYKDFFMPCAAGVGYSYSPYRCFDEIDPKAGMLRLVMGLGTGAVDRVQGSYPRLVNLDRPRMTTAVTSKEKHQFSQRRIDVIDTEKGLVEGKDFVVAGKRAASSSETCAAGA